MTDILLGGGRPAGCPSPADALGRIASFSLGSGRPPATARASGPWAKDQHGRFRTRGRNSVATVRGTRWLTRETSAGTLTRVAEGAVEVRDTRRPRPSSCAPATATWRATRGSAQGPDLSSR
jgi:hypothetical protein